MTEYRKFLVRMRPGDSNRQIAAAKRLCPTNRSSNTPPPAADLSGVESFPAEYEDNDDPKQTAAIRRPCWIVALDGTYGFILDPEAKEFVLVGGSSSSASDWASFGIRGDAVSTLLAR